jgi:transcription-repair coupling factor (superfamily II helicase)
MALLEKNSLFDYLKNDPQKKKLDENEDIRVSSLEALAFLTALAFHEHPRKMFVLFPTIYETEKFSQFLLDYLNDDDCYTFPYDEIFRTSAIGISPEMNEERLLAVSSIFQDKPSILLSHSSASQMNIMGKSTYQSSLTHLKKGDMINVRGFTKKLVSMGYIFVDNITNAGQYSLRGGILDIYDPCQENPIRIEFFGDEIDDLRYFHVSDELSFEHVEEFLLHPATLRLLTEDEIESGTKRIEEEIKNASITLKDRLAYDDLVERVSDVLLDIKAGFVPEVDSRFFSLFSKEENCLLSYLEDYQKYIYDPEALHDSMKDLRKKEQDYFKKAVMDGNSLPGEKIYVSSPFQDKGFHLAHISNDDSFLLRENSFKALSYSESDFLIKEYLKEDDKIRIFLPEPNYSNFDNFLTEKGIAHTCYPEHSPVMLIQGRITHGFELPDKKHVYLSAKEIFGVSDQKSKFLSRYKEAKIIRKYEDLKVGDYVVHEVHGVGRYQGVITMNGLEYLKVEYAQEAIFYLPLSQYRLIRKYSSREGYAPALDRLGGSTWSRKKSKIRSRISYLADQLLALYAERENRPGFAFPKEEEMEEDFMKSFPYPYTESQKQAISDIMADMESTHPMDRLIAGDVGFGKTEVAFNAAFKAILAHKQVVLLCPTTILSNQHYKVAKKRFQDYGVHIEVFNRFVSKPKQKDIIQGLSEGKVDFVIGTHSLLADDIQFKDLGLLIIDEEQKFGVTHKEKIKEKSKNVDCLTLTATPIPRTMQMSLLGVRSMSLLSQAPMNRMPVKTYVAKQDNELIQEVIEKELLRKGQVYYLHNNIASIHDLANRLQKKFPDHKVGVVHAKMSQETIEEVMNQFYQCEIDILVCTSIVESGLDIPNVNTIIVEQADHFGLSQLYQIKGRVGRSDRLAYAYFFFQDASKVTDEGKKRLKALKDFTELGSGYKIAMQDLNIRGAGDILGSEQAGFVDTLGYDAYMELLQVVVKEKKLATSALSDTPKQQFELSFSLDAHIPETYGNEAQRITMYKELSDCSDDDQLNAFSNRIRDVYGPYPDEIANLIIKKKIENHLNGKLYSGFMEALGCYQITMSALFCSKSQIYRELDEKLQPLAVKLRVRVNSNHLFEFILTKTKDYLQDLLFLVDNLDKIYSD